MKFLGIFSINFFKSISNLRDEKESRKRAEQSDSALEEKLMESLDRLQLAENSLENERKSSYKNSAEIERLNQSLQEVSQLEFLVKILLKISWNFPDFF